MPKQYKDEILCNIVQWTRVKIMQNSLMPNSARQNYQLNTWSKQAKNDEVGQNCMLISHSQSMTLHFLKQQVVTYQALNKSIMHIKKKTSYTIHVLW